MKKNKFLQKINSDNIVIEYEMYANSSNLEDVFGSLCGHLSGKHSGYSVHILEKKLKEKKLVFQKREICLSYVESGIKKGTLKKELNYFFLYFDKNNDIHLARIHIYPDGDVHIRPDWFSSDRPLYSHHFMIPARILKT